MSARTTRSRRSRFWTAVTVLVILIGVGIWVYENLPPGMLPGPTLAGGGVTGEPEAAATSAPAPEALGPTGLREVHTPGELVDDMHLAADSCQVRNAGAADGTVLPDPDCTPGAIDPAVTQANIHDTICVSGYTDGIRPSSYSTAKFKEASLEAYDLEPAKTIEYDHLVSLQLGGTNTVSNLWPEPNRAGAPGTTNPKDAVETRLKKAVCAGEITLAAAQQAIAVDWTTAEESLGIAGTGR